MQQLMQLAERIRGSMIMLTLELLRIPMNKGI